MGNDVKNSALVCAFIVSLVVIVLLGFKLYGVADERDRWMDLYYSEEQDYVNGDISINGYITYWKQDKNCLNVTLQVFDDPYNSRSTSLKTYECVNAVKVERTRDNNYFYDNEGKIDVDTLVKYLKGELE